MLILICHFSSGSITRPWLHLMETFWSEICLLRCVSHYVYKSDSRIVEINDIMTCLISHNFDPYVFASFAFLHLKVFLISYFTYLYISRLFLRIAFYLRRIRLTKTLVFLLHLFFLQWFHSIFFRIVTLFLITASIFHYCIFVSATLKSLYLANLPLF